MTAYRAPGGLRNPQGSRTIGSSEHPGWSPSSPDREGPAAGAAGPSLTTEGLSGSQELVAALATLADERIGGAEVFATLTFRDPPARPGSPGYSSVGHGGSVRALDRWLTDAAAVYPGMAAFFAMEPHRDRVAPHFHGLLSGLGPGVAAAVEAGRRGSRGRRPALPAAARHADTIGSDTARDHARDQLWQAWFDANGIARLESVDGNGAALYVSKYSLKAGEDVPWWQLWLPGELRVRRDSRAHRRVHR